MIYSCLTLLTDTLKLFVDVVVVAQPLTGVECVNYFMLRILEVAGVESRKNQFSIVLCIAALKVFTVLLMSPLFDHPRAGRRPLLVTSNVGMGISLVLLGLQLYFRANSNENAAMSRPALAVIALAFYAAFLNVGMGPGPGLVSSEVFSLGFRGKALSLSRFAGRAISAAALSSTLSLRRAISDAGSMFLFAVFCFVNASFVMWCVPETMGLTIEQMRETFEHLRFPCEQDRERAAKRSHQNELTDDFDNHDEESIALQQKSTSHRDVVKLMAFDRTLDIEHHEHPESTSNPLSAETLR